MKILILGASGYLGSSVYEQALLMKNAKVIGTSRSVHESENCIQLDITNQKLVEAKIKQINPDVIVWTVMNRQKEHELINKGLTNLLNVVRKETKLVFISTDAVFSEGKGGYSEMDAVALLSVKSPLAVYVNSKIKAEQMIVTKHSNHVIIRTGPIYGKSANHNIEDRTSKMISNIKKYDSAQAYSNSYRTFVHVEDLTNAILEVAVNKVNGFLHVGPSKKESYFSFFYKRLHQLGWESTFLKSVEIQKDNDFFNPLDTSLNTQKASKILSTEFRSL